MSRDVSRSTSTPIEPFWHYIPDGDGWFRQSRTRRVRVRDRRDTTAVFPGPAVDFPPVELCDACLVRQEHSRGYHVHAVRRAGRRSSAADYDAKVSG